MLTEKHKQFITSLAKSKDDVYLFESDSLSGNSMTLRYRRDWVDNWNGYSSPHYQTSMIFSVKIPDAIWDDKNIKWVETIERTKAFDKFNKMVAEAKELFNQIRKETFTKIS